MSERSKKSFADRRSPSNFGPQGLSFSENFSQRRSPPTQFVYWPPPVAVPIQQIESTDKSVS